jgi:hypothetical protein
MAEVYVMVYLNADEEDVPHWCLWTCDDHGNELVFEALGITGKNFTFNSRSVDMAKSHSRKVIPRIGRIDADVWPEVPDLLKTVPMNKEPGWNCQNWVMEAIAALKREGFLEEDEQGTAYVRFKFQEKTKTYL